MLGLCATGRMPGSTHMLRFWAVVAVGGTGVTGGDIGRLMMFAGGVLFLMGMLVWLGGRLPWFGNLPGDIVVKRDNFTFYAPLGTMLLLSVLLTIVLNVIGRLFR